MSILSQLRDAFTPARKPTISLFMIVKNEKEMLPAALASADWVDEIVVCDTGSTDNTVEIARAAGAKVVHFKWCDDFSAARNFALDACTSDWVLFLDADEVLLPGGEEAIRRGMDEHPDVEGLECWVWNGVNNKTRYPRVFRRIPSIRFFGIVHECVAPKTKTPIEATVQYGKSPAHDADPDRYLRMLGKAAVLEPTSGRYHYYLGRDHWYLGRWLAAVHEFELCLRYSTWMAERSEAFFLMAKCLWELKRGDEAREACMHALLINANFKEAAKFMATLSWPANAVQWNKLAETATNQDVIFIRDC